MPALRKSGSFSSTAWMYPMTSPPCSMTNGVFLGIPVEEFGHDPVQVERAPPAGYLGLGEDRRQRRGVRERRRAEGHSAAVQFHGARVAPGSTLYFGRPRRPLPSYANGRHQEVGRGGLLQPRHGSRSYAVHWHQENRGDSGPLKSSIK